MYYMHITSGRQAHSHWSVERPALPAGAPGDLSAGRAQAMFGV